MLLVEVVPGTAYGANCDNEYACVYCALLRPGPAQTGRLQSITDNFRDRIAEATERADERIGPGLSRRQRTRRSLTHGPAA